MMERERQRALADCLSAIARSSDRRGRADDEHDLNDEMTQVRMYTSLAMHICLAIYIYIYMHR